MSKSLDTPFSRLFEPVREVNYYAVYFCCILEEPLTGVHLHRAVMMNDVMGVERILETGLVQYHGP